MPNYTNSLSAFDSLGTGLQSAYSTMLAGTSQGYKSPAAILESGYHEEEAHRVLFARDLRTTPTLISNVSELSYRAAQENQTQSAQNMNAAYDVKLSQEQHDRQRGNSIAAWQEQELRSYEDSMALQPKGYSEPYILNLPRDFVNLTVTDNNSSENASTARAQEVMTGAIFNVSV